MRRMRPRASATESPRPLCSTATTGGGRDDANARGFAPAQNADRPDGRWAPSSEHECPAWFLAGVRLDKGCQSRETGDIRKCRRGSIVVTAQRASNETNNLRLLRSNQGPGVATDLPDPEPPHRCSGFSRLTRTPRQFLLCMPSISRPTPPPELWTCTVAARFKAPKTNKTGDCDEPDSQSSSAYVCFRPRGERGSSQRARPQHLNGHAGWNAAASSKIGRAHV